MKSTIDVGRHQRNTDINTLARLVIDKGYSRERIMTEIDRLFLNISRSDKNIMLKSIVQKCYENVFESGHRQPVRNYRVLVRESDTFISANEINRCFAVRLCACLIGHIGSNSFRLTADGRFGEEFYEQCINGLVGRDMMDEVEDAEVMIIHLKQAITMLRSAGVIINSGGIAGVADILPENDHLYPVIFTAFWNKVKWEDIFPSMPGAARELKRTRNILIDLVLQQRGRFSIDAVAGEFFELTGFGPRNDIYLISFLDFYFFNWLKHFGIVGYADIENGEAVHLYVTEHGKSFLKHLQSI